MDDLSWSYHEDTPEFYSLVGKPDHYDDRSAEDTVEGESYVTFVIYDEYEWNDKKHIMLCEVSMLTKYCM